MGIEQTYWQCKVCDEIERKLENMVGQWEEVREEIREMKRERKGDDQENDMEDNSDWLHFIQIQEDLNERPIETERQKEKL